MSLIIMTDGLPPKLGGIERYTYELARALQQRHEQLVVITTDLPGGQVYAAGHGAHRHEVAPFGAGCTDGQPPDGDTLRANGSQPGRGPLWAQPRKVADPASDRQERCGRPGRQ